MANWLEATIEPIAKMATKAGKRYCFFMIVIFVLLIAYSVPGFRLALSPGKEYLIGLLRAWF
jgi:hypothetical protein